MWGWMPASIAIAWYIPKEWNLFLKRATFTSWTNYLPLKICHTKKKIQKKSNRKPAIRTKYNKKAIINIQIIKTLDDTQGLVVHEIKKIKIYSLLQYEKFEWRKSWFYKVSQLISGCNLWMKTKWKNKSQRLTFQSMANTYLEYYLLIL